MAKKSPKVSAPRLTLPEQVNATITALTEKRLVISKTYSDASAQLSQIDNEVIAERKKLSYVIPTWGTLTYDLTNNTLVVPGGYKIPNNQQGIRDLVAFLSTLV